MPPTDAIRKVLESEQLVDELAAIEHERWAHWQRYVQLTEREKASDREQVRRYLPVIINALTR